MPIKIHGKDYVTVAERLTEARNAIKSINTEVIQNGGAVVIKATVVTDKGTFTGISSANPDKAIEKQSPYEVAETSAVGRALGFAGYGAVESIATADEMVKSIGTRAKEANEAMDKTWCQIHDKQMKERTSSTGGHWYDHRWQDDSGEWQTCNGKQKKEEYEEPMLDADVWENPRGY